MLSRLGRRTGFTRSRVETSLKSWIFQASKRNCKNCFHNCEDHSIFELKFQSQNNHFWSFCLPTTFEKLSKFATFQNLLIFRILCVFSSKFLHKKLRWCCRVGYRLFLARKIGHFLTILPSYSLRKSVTFATFQLFNCHFFDFRCNFEQFFE